LQISSVEAGTESRWSQAITDEGAIVSYQDNGSGTFVAQTPGLLNTLVKDSVDNLWKESTPDGRTLAYPLNTTGQITSIAYAQDAIGNTHTLSYSGGLLQTLQDAAGRFVTFGYSSGLLQTIEDWAGRTTSFAYDVASAAPKNLLTTVTGPMGCQTQYANYNGTRSALRKKGLEEVLCRFPMTKC